MGDDDELAKLAMDHERLRSLESKCKEAKDEVKARIESRLDGMGVDAAVAGGRRVGFSSRTYYGIKEGQTPQERQANIDALHAWMREVAPEADVPASTNVNRAVQAHLDRFGPEAELPAFIAKTDTRTLTNRQA
jgi:hypothetical protein